MTTENTSKSSLVPTSTSGTAAALELFQECCSPEGWSKWNGLQNALTVARQKWQKTFANTRCIRLTTLLKTSPKFFCPKENISLWRCARDTEVLLCWVFKTGRSLPAKHQSPSVPVTGYSCPRVTETTFPASVLASAPAWRVAMQHCEVYSLPCELAQSNQQTYTPDHTHSCWRRSVHNEGPQETLPKKKSRKSWLFTSF